MAIFTGTGANETITPGFVSATVTRSPLGSFPGPTADTLDGGAGADVMDGGDNNDLYIVDNAGDAATEVFGDALGGIDTVQSSVTHTLSVNLENLTLTGLANIDGTGNARGNTIFGNTGNNTLEGKTGDDTVSGGDGDDLIIWRNGDGTDIVNGGAGIDTQQLVMSDTDGDIATLTASGANAVFARTNLVPFQVTMTDVERVDFQGQGGDDSFTIGDLAGTPITEVLFSGGAGNDTLAGLAGGVATAAPITASGGDGNDTLTGGTAADTLNGDAGNDTLEGHRGNDTVNGGDGDDLIVWRNGDGTDTVDGGAGIDTQQLIMSAGAIGDIGEITVSGANAVFARTNLVPFQVTMTDVERVDFQGQGGDDSFTIGDLAGTPITEVLFSGGAGNDTLAGLAGGVATAAPITASGGDGNDTLTGGTAADTLNGDAGNDT